MQKNPDYLKLFLKHKIRGLKLPVLKTYSQTKNY